jgi:hypothetical protein
MTTVDLVKEKNANRNALDVAHGDEAAVDVSTDPGPLWYDD